MPKANVLLRIHRPKKPRTLRSYKRIAQKNHGRCLLCGRDITEGDEYEAYVIVFDRKFRVDKYHAYCPDDFWEEENEQNQRDLAAHDRAEEQAQNNSRAA